MTTVIKVPDAKEAYKEVVDETRHFFKAVLKDLHGRCFLREDKELVNAVAKIWRGRWEALKARADEIEGYGYCLNVESCAELTAREVEALATCAGIKLEGSGGEYRFDLSGVCEVTSALLEVSKERMPGWAEKAAQYSIDDATQAAAMIHEDAGGSMTKEEVEKLMREECGVIGGEYVLPFSRNFTAFTAARLAAVAES